MNIVFIHQNMPGQFKHLAQHFAAQPGNRVVFITQRENVEIPNVVRIVYKTSRQPGPHTHHYLIRTEDAVLHGQAVTRVLLDIKAKGFRPDIIIAHPGWGESLFAKDVYPDVPLLNYCEYYYRTVNSDMDFNPAAPPTLDSVLRARMRCTHLLLSLEECDRGWSPTAWQRSVHPPALQHKIEVIHEGIDMERLKPDAEATFELPDGRVLTRRNKVVTYVARNLEPYRGFPSFMRSIPSILEGCPEATILLVGGDEISYGSAPEDGQTWRQKMLAEVPVDPRRVIFLGRLPYGRFMRMLQVSTVHVYLTYPFVLSWSMLEAMSTGCIVVASDTHPVREAVTHGHDGLLVDFFSSDRIAAQVVEVLKRPAEFAPLAVQARETIRQRYEVRQCMARQLAMIHTLAGTR
ncbi:MAG: glycosyltransferase family 4 protein [Rhodospirillales bacterium]|nr:glycosyltransferase family 4 protein [Rhodospirillales bacterium]